MKQKKKKTERKVRYKSWETVESYVAFGWNVCETVYRDGKIKCTLGQKVGVGKNM